MAKPLVESIDDLITNIEVFESYLKSQRIKDREFAFKKVRAGQNFIAYKIGDEYHFYPSRYIGHKHATIDNYNTSQGNGGRTDSRITKIIGSERSENYSLEDNYFHFVNKFKMGKPHEKKKKQHRKFWVLETGSRDKKKPYEINDVGTGENDDKRKVYYKSLARKNQAGFRKRLLKHYGCKCAVSRVGHVNVLEAAHVKPFAKEEDNRLSNGILLRSDLHRLFDTGLFAIHPTTLKTKFSKDCLDDYKDLDGLSVFIPTGGPNQKSLEKRWKKFMK